VSIVFSYINIIVIKKLMRSNEILHGVNPVCKQKFSIEVNENIIKSNEISQHTLSWQGSLYLIKI